MTAHGGEASDADLLARRYDTGGIENLFRREAPGLLRYFRRKTGGDESASDLVQDVFLKASTITGWSAIANPAAYLQRIARNLLIDRARKAKPMGQVRIVPLETIGDIAVPPGQHADIEARDMLKAYEDALATLSEKSRNVFLLHRTEDLTYREIAERLDITISTVEYHMMRALAHIDWMLWGK